MTRDVSRCLCIFCSASERRFSTAKHSQQPFTPQEEVKAIAAHTSRQTTPNAVSHSCACVCRLRPPPNSGHPNKHHTSIRPGTHTHTPPLDAPYLPGAPLSHPKMLLVLVLAGGALNPPDGMPAARVGASTALRSSLEFMKLPNIFLPVRGRTSPPAVIPMAPMARPPIPTPPPTPPASSLRPAGVSVVVSALCSSTVVVLVGFSGGSTEVSVS
mmetsp:Transcript_46872/g.116840  ORF Transcript_46872/g.116840 Transcript_46872/m.116840 type:complete len:214 (+) Transcript_46872:202-843(+)